MCNATRKVDSEEIFNTGKGGIARKSENRGGILSFFTSRPFDFGILREKKLTN